MGYFETVAKMILSNMTFLSSTDNEVFEKKIIQKMSALCFKKSLMMIRL